MGIQQLLPAIATSTLALFGSGVGSAITSATETTFFGTNLGPLLTSGSRNVAFGKDCLTVATDATGNIAVGVGALKLLGSSVTQAGTVPTKSYNIAIGDRALESLGQVTGTGGLAYENIIIGNNGGLIATTGLTNTGVGSEVLRFLTTGISNNAYGVSALANVTTGSSNVGIGGGSGGDSTGLTIIQCAPVGLGGGGLGNAIRTGSNNTFLGASTTSAALEPDYMTVIGAGAIGRRANGIFLGRVQETVAIAGATAVARLAISGQNSTSIPQVNFDFTGNLIATPLASAIPGDVWYTAASGNHLICQIGATNVDLQAYLTGVRTFGPSGFNGNYNLFVGKNCGNTTMGGTTAQGVANLCLGIAAGTSITTGSNNTLLGGGNLTTASRCIIIGSSTLASVLTGDNNLFVGNFTANSTTTATNNVVLSAYNAAGAMTTGYQNVIIGNAACTALTTGLQNVGIGYGVSLGVSGGNHVIIGNVTGGGLSTGTGCTIIGGNISGIAPGLTATMILSHGNGTTQATALIVANATAGRYVGSFYDAGAPSAITTVGNATYTAAQFISGVILRSGNATTVTDTTPTAALIVAAIPNAVVNQRVYLYIQNNNTVTGSITLAAGTGVTLSGTTTVSVANTREYLAILTNVTASSEAVTLYGISTAAV